MVEHQGLVNLLWSMLDILEMKSSDRMLALTTIGFDIAGLELYLPLICGAQTIIANRVSAKDPALLAGLLESHKITILQATPSTWRILTEGGWCGSVGLKAVCGGEALPVNLAAQICERADKVFNVYGPTETTVWSSVQTCTGAETHRAPIVPIGRPISNTRIYILGGHGQPARRTGSNR